MRFKLDVHFSTGKDLAATLRRMADELEHETKQDFKDRFTPVGIYGDSHRRDGRIGDWELI